MSLLKCAVMKFSIILAIGSMMAWLWNCSDVHAQTQVSKPGVSAKWTFRLPDGARLGKPVCVGDTVYMNTFNDRLIALDSSNGRLRWTFDPGTGKKYSDDDFTGEAGSFPSPAVMSDQVFFASHDGCLYAVDAKTGSRNWRSVCGNALLSDPVAFGGKVFLGDIEGRVYCIDAATGAKKWGVTMDGEVSNIASPTSGASVIFFTSLFGPGITAFDLESSRERWRWKDSDNGLCQGTRIVSAGYRLYLGSGMCGHLAAFESLNGRQVWNVSLPARNDMMTAFINDAALETVLVSGSPDNLYAFNAATGKQKWSVSFGDHRGWFMEPRIFKGTVYYVGNGKLNAVDEDSGRLKWSLDLNRFQNPGNNTTSQYDHNVLYFNEGSIFMVAPDNSLSVFSIEH